MAALWTAVASAFFHATDTILGEALDLGGMFLFILTVAALQQRRVFLAQNVVAGQRLRRHLLPVYFGSNRHLIILVIALTMILTVLSACTTVFASPAFGLIVVLVALREVLSGVGEAVRHVHVGQRVGLGWTARSCLVCEQCLSGHQNRCPEAVGTIVQRHGGFADRVRAQAAWVIPIPDGVSLKAAGPLFCGGLTVFNPLLQNNIRPTDHVAVVGIGGLGHMAIAFADAWGCEVTAFSTSADKEGEARQLGADHFSNTRDADALTSAAGRFDMVLVTVNVPLDWDRYINTLRPGGKLHLVGATPQVSASVFPLLVGERSIGGSPTGSIATASKMLQFCARHKIEPIIEEFTMSELNAAMDHLASGKARYRIVLKAAGNLA